jgi:hypothetical protein
MKAVRILVLLVLPMPVLAEDDPTVSKAVVKFCEKKVGKKVGDGECWTLARDALAAAGALVPGMDGRDTLDFGRKLDWLETPKPGDVLQFENAEFKFQLPGGKKITASFPHHTAIVSNVNFPLVELYEQNRSVKVSKTTLNLLGLVKGKMTASRPQPKEKN